MEVTAKRKQNDNKNDNSINPKTCFEHQGPLTRLTPKRETVMNNVAKL